MDIPAPVGHTVATTAVVANMLQWLPPALAVLASILSILWFSVQIWESKTFQRILIGLHLRKPESE